MKWLRAGFHSALWFSMTAGSLWALGVDPVTCVRYAWIPTVSMFALVVLIAPHFDLLDAFKKDIRKYLEGFDRLDLNDPAIDDKIAGLVDALRERVK